MHPTTGDEELIHQPTIIPYKLHINFKKDVNKILFKLSQDIAIHATLKKNQI